MRGGRFAAWATFFLLTTAARADPVTFAPTDVGAQAVVPVTLRNPGTGAQTITPSASSPFFVDEAPLAFAPGESRRLEVRFRPTAIGSATGTLRLVSEAREQEVLLRGEGQARATRECVASPCHTARYDAASGTCVEEIDPLARACRTPCVDEGSCSAGVCLGQSRSCSDADACTADRCDAFLGCVSTPLAEATPCGVATCAAMPVCRVGQCLTERLASEDADPRVCGLLLETVERPADPRRAAASLFVRDSGEVHLVGNGLFERRTAAGWSDASPMVAGQKLISFTSAGPDGYWATTNEDVYRFGVGKPLSLMCAMGGYDVATIEGTAERVWLRNDNAVNVCADGVVSTVGSYEWSDAQISVCDDGSVFVVDRYDRDWMWGGVCARSTPFAVSWTGLVEWTEDGWVERGTALETIGPTDTRDRWATMSGTPDDLWLRNGMWGHLHWDGRRFTRVGDDVRAWISPRPGEAWVLGHDGALSHRRRP